MTEGPQFPSVSIRIEKGNHYPYSKEVILIREKAKYEESTQKQKKLG